MSLSEQKLIVLCHERLYKGSFLFVVDSVMVNVRICYLSRRK